MLQDAYEGALGPAPRGMFSNSHPQVDHWESAGQSRVTLAQWCRSRSHVCMASPDRWVQDSLMAFLTPEWPGTMSCSLKAAHMWHRDPASMTRCLMAQGGWSSELHGWMAKHRWEGGCLLDRRRQPRNRLLYSPLSPERKAQNSRPR